MHTIDANDMSAQQAYALLVGAVVPRPIAWITSIDPKGRVNAAPFSCYTFVCNRPPMVAINVGRRGSELKDTARNLRGGGGFVINVVTEDLVAPMHQSSSEYPAGISEPDQLGIELVPSRHVRPPRIALSPIAMECELDRILELGEQKSELVLGRIVTFHVADELLVDGRIDIRKFRPLARLGGPHYARLGEIIAMPAAGKSAPAKAAR